MFYLGSDFKNIVLKLIMQNSSLDSRSEIVLKWMPERLTNGKSTLIQLVTHIHVAIWRHQTQSFWKLKW